MNVDYAENLPEWLNEKEMDLVLSDDIDSLASCALLTKVKGWNIKYFYDFERAYASKSLAKELKTKADARKGDLIWLLNYLKVLSNR